MFALAFATLIVAQPIGFSSALEEAERVPEVAAGREAIEARDALADDVSRITFNPLVQVQAGGRRMQNDQRGGELYLTVSQRLSLSGSGKARRAAVHAEQRQDAASLKLARSLARRRIAEAWLARWTAQQAEKEAWSEVTIARDLSTRTARTLAAGEATRVDTATIDTWAAEAELLALSAEGEAFGSGVLLSEVLGRAERGSQSVDDTLPRIDVASDAEIARRAGSVGAAPAVVSALRTAESEAARLTELRAARGTNLGIGGMGWREGTGDLAAVAMLELELPVFERGERERAAQAAAAARARGQARASEVAERARRARLVHELEHTRAVLDVLEQRFSRAAEDLARAQEKRLAAREATSQDWVIARRQVLRAKIDTARARAAHVLARFLVAELDAEGER